MLRELSTALDKMSTKLQEHAGRMREQRAQTEPSRDPTNPDDTNVTTIKRHVGSCHQHCQLFPADRALGTNLRHVCAFPCACVGGLNNPRFEALGEALHAVEMYIPVVVTDKMIGIKRNKSSIARREMRRTYFEQLRFTDMAIKLHTYKRGGPYPNLVHVRREGRGLHQAARRRPGARHRWRRRPLPHVSGRRALGVPAAP